MGFIIAGLNDEVLSANITSWSDFWSFCYTLAPELLDAPALEFEDCEPIDPETIDRENYRSLYDNGFLNNCVLINKDIAEKLSSLLKFQLEQNKQNIIDFWENFDVENPTLTAIREAFEDGNSSEEKNKREIDKKELFEFIKTYADFFQTSGGFYIC